MLYELSAYLWLQLVHRNKAFSALTGLLGVGNSVYQVSPCDCRVVSLFNIRSLGVCPVSWQGCTWWIASLSYGCVPPAGYMLLFHLPLFYTPYSSPYNQHFVPLCAPLGSNPVVLFFLLLFPSLNYMNRFITQHSRCSFFFLVYFCPSSHFESC